MIVGVAVYNGRIAPRCVCTEELLLLTIRRNRVRDRHAVNVSVDTPLRLSEVLSRHQVDTFVCGGLHRDARESLEAQGVEIIDNVACSVGDAVSALESGSLVSGYGFGSERVPDPSATGNPPAPIDCLSCHDRRCLLGQACPHDLPTVDSAGDLATHRMLEASADIAAEPERRLCRLAELVYFCLEMGYRTIGIAYCTELSEPAEILTSVLRRFFDVVPVCCRICNTRTAGRGHGDPELQAAALDAAGCELNVIVGLCIGIDCAFTRASRAPVTTLFVKDRSLANNPIGALYSEYHIRESVAPGEPRSARAARQRAHVPGHASPRSSEEEP